MTHLIKKDSKNLIKLTDNSCAIFASDESFEVGDTVIVQDNRSETTYTTEIVYDNLSFLKKGHSLIVLTEKD